MSWCVCKCGMDRKQDHSNPGKNDPASAKPTRGILKIKSPGTALTPSQTRKAGKNEEDDSRAVLPAISMRDPRLGTSVQSKHNTNSGIDQQHGKHRKKSQRWDELNIMATYHPADKDYGHMKVDEPRTPFVRTLDDGTELDTTMITPELLAERLAAMDGISPQLLQAVEGISSSGQNQGTQHGKDEFLAKRKAHYSEGRHFSKSRAQRNSSDDLFDSTDVRPKVSEGKIHLRLAQHLLQEKESKTDPEDMEFLAPVLSRRTSVQKPKPGIFQMLKERQPEYDRRELEERVVDSRGIGVDSLDDTELDDVEDNSPDGSGEQAEELLADGLEDAKPSNQGLEHLPSQPSTSTAHSSKGKKPTK